MDRRGSVVMKRVHEKKSHEKLVRQLRNHSLKCPISLKNYKLTSRDHLVADTFSDTPRSLRAEIGQAGRLVMKRVYEKNSHEKL